MTGDIWNEVRLNQMIQDEIEESLNLDYKAAGSLEKSDKKRIEITKDVSAMSNSAGGTIIYGISEFQSKDKKHLPEKLDPIDRKQFPKEWLEQVIGGVQPRIPDVIIHPVQLSTQRDHVAYVVEIPQSTTAHQAKDLRYYRRFNFESVPMHDYEVRDTMNRASTARAELDFELYYYIFDPNIERDAFGMPIIDVPTHLPRTPKKRLPRQQSVQINVFARNVGRLYIKHLQCFYYIHKSFIPISRRGGLPRSPLDNSLIKLSGNNRYTGGPISSGVGDVILPGLEIKVGSEVLDFERVNQDLGDVEIFWEIYADNAPLQTGTKRLVDIPRRVE